MQYSSVLVLQRDTKIAQAMVASLCSSFFSVHAVPSLEELCAAIVKHRAEVVILDMEVASLADVQRMCKEFPRVSVVCTHRLADDEMWTSALNVGAADVCPPTDIKGVLLAALRNVSAMRKAAA